MGFVLFLHLVLRMQLSRRFGSNSVQNTRLDGKQKAGSVRLTLAQKLHSLTSKHFLTQPTLAGELDGQDRRRRNENGERERS